MKTSDLDFALKLAQPCVTSIDLVPVMTHYCFDKDKVFAYDEVSGIIVGLETDLHCALRGESLLPLVALAGQEITLEANGDANVSVRSGKSMKAELPALAPESFIYEEPRANDKTTIRFSLTDEFIIGLGICSAAVSDNPHYKERTAVMFVTGKNPVLYAYDGTALVKYTLSKPIGSERRPVLIPKSICDQIIGIKEKVKAKSEGIQVALSRQHMQVTFKNAKEFADFPVSLVGNLLTALTPEQFEETLAAFESWVKKAAKRSVFELPKGFYRAVDRTMIFVGGETEPHCCLSLLGLGLTIEGRSGLGETRTTLKVKTEQEATAELDPKRLAKYREMTTHIAMTAGQVALYDASDPKDAQLTYLVACWSDTVKKEKAKAKDDNGISG